NDRQRDNLHLRRQVLRPYLATDLNVLALGRLAVVSDARRGNVDDFRAADLSHWPAPARKRRYCAPVCSCGASFRNIDNPLLKADSVQNFLSRISSPL